MGDDSEIPLEIIELEPAEPSGRQREPRAISGGIRGRKVPIFVAIAVVVGLVVSVIVGRAPSHDRAAGPTSTTADARKTTLNLRGTGSLFSDRVGAELLTGGAEGLQLIDTDTGARRTLAVPGLPLGPLRIVAHSGTTVAVSLGAYLYWFTLPDGAAHRIDARTAFPAAEPGHLWLATGTVAIEVPDTRDGRPGRRVETAYPAIGATRSGLLEKTDNATLIEGVDPHRAPRNFPAGAAVIGVHADRVAWVSTCGALRCPVHITEVATGATSTWFQLPGHPSDLALQSATARFSADGSRLAVVLPDDNVTRATTIVVGDLRERTTSIVDTTDNLIALGEATGMRVDWTRDGNFLVLMTELENGAGRLGAVDPANGRVLTSRVNRDGDSSLAATGTSAVGPLDLPRRPGEPIATGPEPRVEHAGLELVGGDRWQVDALDLGTGAMRTTYVGAVVPNPGGPFSIARVTTGWLIVRNAVVSLLADGTPPPYLAQSVDAGTQVLAARGGRIAWLALGVGTGQWRVSTYDPATRARGQSIPFVGALGGAVDAGIVFTRPVGATTQAVGGTEIVLVDESGHLRTLASVYSASLHVVASGGDTILYTDEAGLHALNVPSGSTQLLADAIGGAAVSPDGMQLAWIRADGRAVAALLDSHGRFVSYATFDATADRVLVANDGTVIATLRTEVWQSRVGASTTQRVYGVGVDPSTELALG